MHGPAWPARVDEATHVLALAELDRPQRHLVLGPGGWVLPDYCANEGPPAVRGPLTMWPSLGYRRNCKACVLVAVVELHRHAMHLGDRVEVLADRLAEDCANTGDPHLIRAADHLLMMYGWPT